MALSFLRSASPPAKPLPATSVLVIKNSALGDLVLAMPACKAIREAHPGARITLLTTAPFRELMEDCPYFDAVRLDPRRKLYTPSGLLGTARMLREGDPDIIYDLQTADRTSWYYWCLRITGPTPPWNGIAPGCDLRQTNPNRKNMHTLERQADQLAYAGLPRPEVVAPPDLSWARADLTGLLPEAPFALLIPGGSPHRAMKRWPVERFAELARDLVGMGLIPVVLGTSAEAEEAARILEACPEARSLVNRTSIHQLAALATKARLAVGGDTGPLHLVAAAGAPSLGLYSEVSIPALCAPRGRWTEVVREDDLRDLRMGPVRAAVEGLLAKSRSLETPG